MYWLWPGRGSGPSVLVPIDSCCPLGDRASGNLDVLNDLDLSVVRVERQYYCTITFLYTVLVVPIRTIYVRSPASGANRWKGSVYTKRSSRVGQEKFPGRSIIPPAAKRVPLRALSNKFPGQEHYSVALPYNPNTRGKTTRSKA